MLTNWMKDIEEDGHSLWERTRASHRRESQFSRLFPINEFS